MIEFGEYGLGSDAQNWIVFRKTVSKTTHKTVWTPRYFYFHLHEALHGLWDDFLRQKDYPDAKALLDAVTAATARVEAAGKQALRPGRKIA